MPSGLIAATVQRCDQLVAIPADGTSMKNVSRNLACNGLPVVSRGGEVAFLKAQGPKRGIAVMAPDGSGQRYVAESYGAQRPRWSPVDRRLLYIDGSAAVHVLDLDSGSDRTVGLAVFAEWSPDGKEIAGVWQGRLIVFKADGSGQRTISTTAFAVIIQGWSSRGAIAFEAPDGYIWTIRADGSDERRVTLGYSGSWSPDGTRLAVYRGVNWPSDIAVVREDGTEIAVLSAVGESVPAWSPDGTRVAFRLGNHVQIADSSGGPQIAGPIVGPGAPEDALAWSPDGATILATWHRNDFDVIGIDSRTGARKRVLTTVANELWPAFSPDGEQVLFSKVTEGAGRLYLARRDGNAQKVVTDDARPGAAWSPDGSRIAYVSDEGDLRVTLARAGAGGGALVAHRVQYASPSWSPNGRRLVFSTTKALATVRPDGRGRRRILKARPGTRLYWPRWSPRGDRVSFTEYENCDRFGECYGPAWIAIVAPSGHSKDRLAQGTRAGWSPDGRFLAFARGEVTLFDLARRKAIVLSQVPSEAPPDWRPICTVRGSTGSDVLRGTRHADLVCGLRGNDTIIGRAGQDKLLGEEGNDLIRARDGGFDVIGCGPGRDTVIADRGDLVGRDCELVSRR